MVSRQMGQEENAMVSLGNERSQWKKRMNNDDYLIKLKDPEVWFEHAFAQKMVADKLLVDVIM